MIHFVGVHSSLPIKLPNHKSHGPLVFFPSQHPYLHIPSSNEAFALYVTNLEELFGLLKHSTAVTVTGRPLPVFSPTMGRSIHLGATGVEGGERRHGVHVCVFECAQTLLPHMGQPLTEEQRERTKLLSYTTSHPLRVPPSTIS